MVFYGDALLIIMPHCGFRGQEARLVNVASAVAATITLQQTATTVATHDLFLGRICKEGW